MKRYLLTLVFALGLCGLAIAQSNDQNPRARQAYEEYKGQADSLHAATLGATIDKTYEAYDPIQIKKDRREERREFRRQLRLERARRPAYRAYPYGYDRWYW